MQQIRYHLKSIENNEYKKIPNAGAPQVSLLCSILNMTIDA